MVTGLFTGEVMVTVPPMGMSPVHVPVAPMDRFPRWWSVPVAGHVCGQGAVPVLTLIP